MFTWTVFLCVLSGHIKGIALFQRKLTNKSIFTIISIFTTTSLFSSMFKKAFTLIEMLIVIVIIWILATALIPRFTGAQNKARYARVEKDFRDFNTAAFMAQSNTNKTLGQLYSWWFGWYWSDWGNCGAWNFSGDSALTNLPDSHTCVMIWKNLLRTVELYAGMSSWTLKTMERDPWWNPYVFDLNDGESWWGVCWTYDTIHTVGPDWFARWINFANAPLDEWDNKWVNVAQAFCRNAY